MFVILKSLCVAGSEEAHDEVPAVFHHGAEQVHGLRAAGGARPSCEGAPDGGAEGEHQDSRLHLRWAGGCRGTFGANVNLNQHLTFRECNHIFVLFV